VRPVNTEEQYRLRARVASAFSPSAPINSADLFAGRTKQVERATTALFQRGQHVILFGERGVGKTSLASTLYDLLYSALSANNIHLARFNCSSDIRFEDLWRGLFRELLIEESRPRAGFEQHPSSKQLRLDSLLPEDVTPETVRFLLERVPYTTILVIDEIDRIVDRKTTTMLADTIKSLSDHSVDTTIILVGVADSVEQIITEHCSIERALVQIQMPRMSHPELLEIVEKGLTRAEMTMEPQAKQEITKLSQGLPHYTHSLSLYSAQEAINKGRTHIMFADVDAAIKTAVGSAQHSLVSAHHRAISSPRENLYQQVLLACALARTDELGYFSAVDVRAPMSRIMGRPYEIAAFSRHLNDFCETARGPILQKTGATRRFMFRFLNPLMEPFVVMKGLAEGSITREIFVEI
jgi:Cdc6-like AAA superfamily ATPase